MASNRRISRDEQAVISSPFSLDNFANPTDPRGFPVDVQRTHEIPTPQPFSSGVPFSSGIPYINRGTPTVNATNPARFDKERTNRLENIKDAGTTLGGLIAGSQFVPKARVSAIGKPTDMFLGGGGVKSTIGGLIGNFAVDAMTEKTDNQRIQRIQDYAKKKHGLSISVEDAKRYMESTGDYFDNPEVGAFYGMNIPGLGFHGTKNAMSMLGDVMNPWATLAGRGIGNRQMDVGYDAMDEMIADRANSNRTRDALRKHAIDMYGDPNGEYGGISEQEVRAKFPDLFADEGDAKYGNPRTTKREYTVKPTENVPYPMRTPRNL